MVCIWINFIRGRPFDILGGGGGGGGGAGLFSKKILSLVLQEKNYLALKRVKTQPGLNNNEKKYPGSL